jgi:hypothetical protein
MVGHGRPEIKPKMKDGRAKKRTMVDQKLKRRIIQLSADHDANDDMPVLRSLHCALQA